MVTATITNVIADGINFRVFWEYSDGRQAQSEAFPQGTPKSDVKARIKVLVKEINDAIEFAESAKSLIGDVIS
jgi:hypothetical protein